MARPPRSSYHDPVKPALPTVAALDAPTPTKVYEMPAELRKRVRRSRAASMSFDGTLRSICTMLRGGQGTFLHLVRLAASTDPAVARFIEKWDDLTVAARRQVSLEALCAECGFDWTHLVGAATEASLRTGNQAAAMIAALEQPKIVANMTRFAKERQGVEDRRMLLQHSNFLPQPKGNVMALFQNIGAQSGEGDDQTQFVSFERDIIELDKVLDMSDARTDKNEGGGEGVVGGHV